MSVYANDLETPRVDPLQEYRGPFRLTAPPPSMQEMALLPGSGESDDELADIDVAGAGSAMRHLVFLQSEDKDMLC